MLLQTLTSLALASTALCAPTTNSLGRRDEVDHDSLDPIATRIQSGALGAAIEKFNPRLHIASGCQPYTAVDDSGNTKQVAHGGLKPSGSQTGGCEDTAKGQTYARATQSNGKVAIMYSWYMPKDQTVDNVSAGAHRHDFESVVIWLGNDTTTVLGGAASGHGEYTITSGAVPGGDSPTVEYFATFPTNHEVQFTQTVGKTYPVSDWDAMPDDAKSALQDTDFGAANVPFKRMLLQGLLILICFSLAVSAHETGRRWSGNIIERMQLQAVAERYSDSASNMTEFVNDLGSQLSPEASITLYGSDDFDNLTARWTSWEAPGFKASVQVYTEEDVINTIMTANKFELPWLAVSGRHGGIQSLSKLDAGVQINLDHLGGIDVSSDGKSASIGRGMTTKAITDALWDQGKWTATGACECTSLAGPMLGGGHGFLQGRFGLALDNLVSARVVLGNGSVVAASDGSHPDLFWALRGAGHNFGVVTEVQYKIYDVPEEKTWIFAGMFFTADKVEQVFQVTNDINNRGDQPLEVVNIVQYLFNPAISPGEPVIEVLFLSEGTEEEAEKYLSLYRAIGIASSTLVNATYPDFSRLFRFSEQDASCLEGKLTVQRFPVDLEVYNITTQKEILLRFGEIVAENPFLNNSIYLWENYGSAAVKAVPDEATAFPDRFNTYLTAPALIYVNSTAEKDEIVRQAGEELRSMAIAGRGDGKLNAYVNYANGDETLEELYGHDAWRLEKLRKLKQVYDPDSRLKFYAPIA
ncbi:hypothetical protein diail_6289 [Diaporthe ilicicola]|nr:hypothetical protein diail_6289 [Diaporthe ilicicola]